MLAAAGLWLACVCVPTAPQATTSDAPQAPPIPVEARLGAALVRATRGEFEAAAAALAELAKGGAAAEAPLDDALKQRLERERTRLEALAAARRDFLERCVKEQRKLHLKQGEKSVAGTVAELTADHFVVADAKGRRQELALAALDPDELLKRMAEQKFETGSAATRAYAALLAGRKNWAKGLDGAGEGEAASLRADGASLGPLLSTGGAVLALEELTHVPPAAGGTPDATPRAEGATLDAIKALLADHGRDALVVERRPLLKQLATDALTTRFDARGIAGAGLKGAVEALPDGAARLTYDFKTADGLADFAAADASRPEVHPSWSSFEIKLPKAQWKRAIDEEALRLVGEGCLRHRVEFAAPVALEYEVEYGAPLASMSSFSTLRAALCDDGLGTMVTNLDLTSVDAYQHGRRILDSSDPGEAKLEIATRITYHVRLEDDGKEAKLLVAERPEQKIAAPPLQRGGVALYWKSDAPLRLFKLTIEGRVAPDGLANLRAAAVARDLAALFGE